MSSSEAGETSPSPKGKRIAVAVGLVVLVCLIVIAQTARLESPVITLRFVGFKTNTAGIAEAHFELKNDAGPCTLEPQVLFVSDEEYGTTNRQWFQMNQSKAWSVTSLDGDLIHYYIAKGFSNDNTGLRVSTGTNLNKGQTAAISFPKPEGSWRFMVDCWRIQTSGDGGLHSKLADWNQVASRKLGLPIVFKNGDWAHAQITTGAVPSKALNNGRIPARVLDHPHVWTP